ncbi:hypothetical protein L873DRAFT_1846939 [Choiromyces venosus 120613-1]|uniref:Uncharacterized protein n=1 Tax=Choiromyces venosus 120613-1 TaxID=1336337 RepID=A0A3N4J6J4_9PEZI|nr:hypothetical protein L873DRAFT_1846939 [Choiromyces venosus 120613-1]
MAPSTNSALNPIGSNPPHAPPISTNFGADLHCDGYLRESPASLMSWILSSSARSKPKSWWRAQCVLYGISIDEKTSVAEMRSSLERAVNKQGRLSVVEEIPEEMAESERKTNERVRKTNVGVRDAASVGSKDASFRESASGSVKEGGKGKGKKLAEKDRDVLKVVKSGPKVGKKAVKKVITKTVVVSKTVKVSKKKVPKAEVGPTPPPPPPPEESLDVDPYEGEPMMWPMDGF